MKTKGYITIAAKNYSWLYVGGKILYTDPLLWASDICIGKYLTDVISVPWSIALIKIDSCRTDPVKSVPLRSALLKFTLSRSA